MATRNIMVRAGADFSQLSTALRQAQQETSLFGNNMEGIFTRIGLVGNGIKTVFEGIVHAVEGLGEFAKEAGELDGRLSSLNNRLQGSAQQFQNWAQANGQALGLSNKDMIEQGASISAMLETSIHDKQQLAQQTENMLKNIAIVSSATGKSQQEVSERMVSALQGHSAAVSALDLNMHLSSLRMSESYKRIAGSTPWAKLTAEQQQLIIVSNLNEQVQQRFGKTVVEDVATRMNRFTASLSNVKTSLEQAFTPILYAVLPYLTTFINYINTALQYVTVFFQTLIGYSGAKLSSVTGDVQDQADAVNGLSGAYDNLGNSIGKSSSKGHGANGVTVPKVKAAGVGGTDTSGSKKVGTGFTASFDQVHTIPEATGSGSGAKSGGSGGAAGAVPSGGGSPVDPKPTENALQQIQEKMKGFVDKVKSFLAPIGKIFSEIWGGVSSYFKGVIDQISKWWNQWGGQIIQAFKNVSDFLFPIIMFIAQFIWDSIKGAINGIVLFFEGLIEFLSSVFTGNWKGIFQGLWDMIKGGIQAVWNIFNLIFVADGIGAIADFAKAGLKLFGDMFDGIGVWLKNFASNLLKGFWDCIQNIKNFFKGLGDDLNWEAVYWEQTFKQFWNGLVDGGKNAWEWIKGIFVDAYNWFNRFVITPIINGFNNIVNGFSTGGITGGLKAIWNEIADYINNAIGMINGITGNLPGGGSLNIGWRAPHFFAKGGIVTGATNAVVGEAGTEVIQPLSALQGLVANTVAQTIATVMNMQKSNNNNVGGDIVLKIDGRQFARIIKPYSDMEQKRVGTNLRLQTL